MSTEILSTFADQARKLLPPGSTVHTYNIDQAVSYADTRAGALAHRV
jgi:hypothetical protein